MRRSLAFQRELYVGGTGLRNSMLFEAIDKVALETRFAPLGQGLFIHEVSRSHTTTHHSRSDSSGRVISSSQRPLPDNTQHSKQSPVGFEHKISPGELPQTYPFDREVTWTGLKTTLPLQILKEDELFL
jgi:hypothetical protein